MKIFLNEKTGEPMGAVKIKKVWDTISDQKVEGGDGKVWMVVDLIERAKDLPVKEIPLDHLAIDFNIGGMRVRDFVAHMKLILEADMSYPIILDDEACFFDGRHRMARALLEEHETIKAVRFEEDPPATYMKSEC